MQGGMRPIEWDSKKNEWLIKHRGVSFELCATMIREDKIISVIGNHPPYEHQKIFILDIDGYAYMVPYVEDDEKYFLKTIFPSRDATKKYLPDNESHL